MYLGDVEKGDISLGGGEKVLSTRLWESWYMVVGGILEKEEER